MHRSFQGIIKEKHVGLSFCMVHYKEEHSKYHVMSQIILLNNLNKCSLSDSDHCKTVEKTAQETSCRLL